ncbi:glycoside hydrolase family 28 protein [Chitinophaga sp. GCM10012297]|uniref:Glycoside hydrolase family 28 protein n=1 Tax=Chitinophaga chungangae TaxID=2821488 RepID=A0ABS3YFW6_9BACT|nr:glycoside hydrolase family 28 protein [Chitinophaga chungangae]MBO9153561.1 glycoside hydrolase family 28 protein [Chitinophaga chungangae]
MNTTVFSRKPAAALLAAVFLSLGVLASAKDINIASRGAKGDGQTLNTTIIQQAIDECSQSGGGNVIIPAGKFLSGTVVLKNNVTLHLEENAVLLGSTNVNDYTNPDPFTDGLGIDVGWALLAAVDATNIGIEGEGAINGQGAALKARQIETDTRPESLRWGRRPFLVRIVRCNGVKVSGVQLQFAAAWTSHYFQCKNVTIENVKILSHGVAHNDGIDIDGCQDVKIARCDIQSGDDALCFKTTSSAMACRNIEVTDMRLKSGHGAIKMGTESMAPFENIKISRCYIYDTNNGGIKLLTVDGAHLRNVTISDITMENVKTPMLFRLGSRLSVFRKGKDTQQPTGTFTNVTVRNVKAHSAKVTQLTPPSGILITGVPGHYITGLTLENIGISLAGGGTAEDARHEVPEAIDKYPEVKTFGPTIPAYGIWARHVKDLQLKNITFKLDGNDVRPAFVCEDGQNVTLKDWTLPETNGAESIIRLENVEGANITGIHARGRAADFVKVEGEKSKKQKHRSFKIDKHRFLKREKWAGRMRRPFFMAKKKPAKRRASVHL